MSHFAQPPTMPDKDTLSLEIELLELEHKRIQLDIRLWHKRHEILTAKAAKPHSVSHPMT